ncbi:MAG TPA: response regulator [Polyangiaceae bacterium]|jgi:DNA-binding response OmpR family regulator|nr:response regulator [Polyangiaceae bacterium]
MSASVLIVDDSLTVRMDLTEALQAAGFEVRPCSTLAEARQILATVRVALVVLDLLLPDGDGLELLREIRAGTEDVQPAVLLLSTEAEVKDRIRGLQTGADDYIGKPYDVAYVVARAKELVRAQAAGPSEGSTVLVVDDSSTFREELRRAFEGAGYAVLTASSGEDGLRVAAANRPSALVVDGVMPGIDGATVIRKIRMDPALRRVPCLLMTASQEGGDELRALDAGADAFVRKEEDVELILARLRAVLRAAASQPADTSSLLGPMRILAVDDSPTYLHELSTILRGEGYDVVSARSGEDAIEMLAVQPVDCILLDLRMPGIDGHETCRRIKAAPIVRDIPLILLTAVEDRTAVLDGFSTGADDFISKSSEVDVLKARVRAQLRRKQFEDEHRRVREELLRSEMDASEQRAARALAEERAAHVEELERKNRELEAFSYSVSHDLRAPLRSIDGFSKFLLEDNPDLAGSSRDHLNRIRASAQRMSELIDDLLELSRVSRIQIVRTAVDLSAIARLVVDDLQRREPERHVEVAIEAGLEARGDGRLLRAVLENLVGNAWKFSSKQPAARIEIGGIRLPEGVVYLVRDNGAGFDAANAHRLFAPFQRLHSQAEFSGTGIGLATVYRIVDRHGGRVWAESTPGKGATFYFTVPER